MVSEGQSEAVRSFTSAKVETLIQKNIHYLSDHVALLHIVYWLLLSLRYYTDIILVLDCN